MDSNFMLFYEDKQPLTTCFTKCNFKPGQLFSFKISHIYDPSKFWIVVKFQELELFQKNLFKYYYLNHNKHKMPRNLIQLGLYCVVFTDGGYYRGKIVSSSPDMHGTQQIHVLFLDYGLLQLVDPSNIYHLTLKYWEIPQFCVRASLAEVRPRNAEGTWTSDDVTEFTKLVADRTLTGLVVTVYSKRQVLDIQFRERCNGSVPVHETLIAQKRAVYVDERYQSGKKQVMEPKHNGAHWLPCHGAIESGKVPSSLCDFDYQAAVSPLSKIVARYFKVEDY